MGEIFYADFKNGGFLKKRDLENPEISLIGYRLFYDEIASYSFIYECLNGKKANSIGEAVGYFNSMRDNLIKNNFDSIFGSDLRLLLISSSLSSLSVSKKSYVLHSYFDKELEVKMNSISELGSFSLEEKIRFSSLFFIDCFFSHLSSSITSEQNLISLQFPSYNSILKNSLKVGNSSLFFKLQQIKNHLDKVNGSQPLLVWAKEDTPLDWWFPYTK